MKRVRREEMWLGTKWTHRAVHGREKLCRHREKREKQTPHHKKPAWGRHIPTTFGFGNLKG